MTRAEWIGLGGLVAALAAFGVVSFHGSIEATRDRGQQLVRGGLADATDTGETSNRWTAPSWEMARVGVTPLRQNHPLFRRPPYIGHNRHKVMCDGWNGWYDQAPENEVL